MGWFGLTGIDQIRSWGSVRGRPLALMNGVESGSSNGEYILTAIVVRPHTISLRTLTVSISRSCLPRMLVGNEKTELIWVKHFHTIFYYGLFRFLAKGRKVEHH
jgi:hypothetical protein